MRARLLTPLSGLALCAAAAGQPVGPDVIVSNIGLTITKYGTANVAPAGSPARLITGYAVATTSCNIGDADAVWFHDTTAGHGAGEHPVIGTQMYRLFNGRFEQIGLSWLKHGFCADDAPDCLSLARPGVTPATRFNGSCDWLGLYETDTYSASLNGQQGLLGPRSEINAALGTFPYPFVLGAGATGDCTAKRLQIANDDLSPALFPGARYFCEVHYVTTDEATTTGPSGESRPERADVRANNASYREVLVGSVFNQLGAGCTSSQPGYLLSFTGATIAKQAAIAAWRAADPAVTLVNADVPLDGRIVVGAKATDLGGGLWQYEYAVYNHNSHRSVGSVSIPKAGAAVSPTNLGFHDVSYHSGEPYSGADWTPSVTDSAVSWSTEPYAVNPNANAIRWSTLYNFRFQAAKAPIAGSVTLGLFRPATGAGQPDAVTVTGLPVPMDRCIADFNGAGGVSIQDLFDFLGAYFAGQPAADVDGTPGITVEDVFAFLAAWFRGC